MKNSKKIVSLSLAATMLASTGTAFAALPDSTLVIGSDAFNVLELSNLTTEIDAALNKIEGDVSKIYYDLEGDSLDGYYDLDGKVKMTDEVKTELGEITLHKADGTTEKYENIDAETPVAKWAIASASATNGKLTVVLSGSNETAPVASDFAATVKVDAGDAAATTLTNFAWDVATKTATMDFPEVAGKDAEQTVVVAVTFDGVAKEATYKVPVTTDLAVESVSAINLKQVKVVFTQEVDKTSAELNTNINLYESYVSDTNKGTATTNTNYTRTLLDDNKTLMIVMNGGSELSQDTTLGVSVKNVEAKDDATTKIADFMGSSSVIDTTKPVVESAVVENSKTIKVAISEALNIPTGMLTQTDKVLIDTIPAVASITVDAAKNEMTISLGTSLSTGAHKLELKNLADYAGFKIADTSFDISVVADANAPSITSAKSLSKDEVEVTFDEVVTKIGTLNITTSGANTFTDAAGKQAADAVLTAGQWKLSTDGKVATFKLTNALSLGSTVEQAIKYINTEDAEGNKVATETTFKFSATDDTALPTVTSVEVSTATATKNQLTINFDKVMDGAPKVTITKADGTTKVLDQSSQAYEANDKKKVVIAAGEYSASNTDAGTWTLKVEDATDNTIRGNEMADYTTTITVQDTKKPTVNAVLGVDAEKKMTVYFSEAMDATTLADTDNYLVDFDGTGAGAYQTLSNIAGASATVAADSKSVVLAWTSSDVVAAGTAVSDTNITMLNLKDASGNLIAGFNTAKDVEEATLFNGDSINKIELVAKNKIKVYLTGTTFSNVDPADFKVYNEDDANNVDVFVGASAELNTDKDEVTITLNGSLNADGTYGSSNEAAEVYVTSGNTTNFAGSKLAYAKGDDTNANDIVDKVVPTLLSAKLKGTSGADAKTIVLDFDETVVANADLKYDLKLMVQDTIPYQLAANEFTANVVGGNLEIRVDKAGIDTKKVTVELLNGRYLKDSTGNEAKTFAAMTVKNSAATADATIETVVPTITKAETQDLDNNGKIDAYKITFSENIEDDNVTVGDFAIAAYANPAFSKTTAGDVEDNNVIYITFDEGGAVDTDAKPELTYTAGDLTDLMGNKLANVANGDVTEVDMAAPVYVSVNTVLASGPVTLTFSEPVTSDALVLADFAGSTVNSVAITALTADADAVAGTTIVTNGDLAPAGNDAEALVLTLASSGAAKIKDASNNTVNASVLSRTDLDVID